MPTVPSDLLGAIADPTGGKVAIIIGAGSSIEAPTRLPLSKKCAEDAHERLIADGVLVNGDCADPADLSALADAVYTKRNNKQEELVSRLPVTEFRNAKPNEGHVIAAALLVERAVIDVLSLNFDHAQEHALPVVDAGSNVSVVYGPQDHSQVGVCNFIYLHRDAGAKFEDWILRSQQLTQEWQGKWEEVISLRVSATPHLVFAGLGSPAKVLVESVLRIKTAVPIGHKVYYVDPGQLEASAFASSLAITVEQHISLGWVEFMKALAARVAEEHIRVLRDSCADFATNNAIQNEDCDGFLGELKTLGLIALGRIRAVWQLEMTVSYLPHRGCHHDQYADLVQCIALIERITSAKARPDIAGCITLHRAGKPVCTVVPISGRGTRTFAMIEPMFAHFEREIAKASKPTPVIFLLSGVQGTPEVTKLPSDIVMGEQLDNLVLGKPKRSITDVFKARQYPKIIQDMIGNA